MDRWDGRNGRMDGWQDSIDSLRREDGGGGGGGGGLDEQQQQPHLCKHQHGVEGLGCLPHEACDAEFSSCRVSPPERCTASITSAPGKQLPLLRMEGDHST